MDQSPSVKIPVIDLFAGPGGLSEGFSRFPMNGAKRFKIALSIERDPHAHSTLTLRAFYRQFPEGAAPEAYYAYLRGEITRDELFGAYPQQSEAAKDEARLLTLGLDNPHQLIQNKLRGAEPWVLIGGPPCQAYSLVGRSKILGSIKKEANESIEGFNRRRQSTFDEDERQELYKEYLAIIARHWPSIFVMENVRGIISAKHRGERIIPKILRDLSNPAEVFAASSRRHTYRIYSLTTPTSGNPLDHCQTDFLIRSELYGIPQARHRVILLGVRNDLDHKEIPLLKQQPAKTVHQTIGDLPSLTPGVTKLNGKRPYDALAELRDQILYTAANGELFDFDSELIVRLERSIALSLKRENRGTRFYSYDQLTTNRWFFDHRLGGVCNHQTRSHIKEELWRYAFASCYAELFGSSPQLKHFPQKLLPKHANIEEALSGQKFGDRFRVQLADKPASTITSHISKDGHY